MRTTAGVAVVLVAALGCGSKRSTPTSPDRGTPSDAGVVPEGTDAAVAMTPGGLPTQPALDPMCRDRPEKTGPYRLTAEMALARYGTQMKTYAEIDMSGNRSRAVEVCGLPAARDWLTKTNCPDGVAGEQLGRVGTAGKGGRCGSMIEKFKVRCPDGAIDIYFDIYMCGPGEAM